MASSIFHKKKKGSTLPKIILIIIIGIVFFKVKIDKEVGKELDSFNNVKVYFNGFPTKSFGRNLSEDGYNIGMKYQCVEFIKRYYFEYYNHKMPDTYGNAKDFYNKELKDGEINIKRGLLQFSNPSFKKPSVGDIIIFKPYILNPYGHVAIISNVEDDNIEIVQQNVWKKTREKFKLTYENNKWSINSKRVIGRLSLSE